MLSIIIPVHNQPEMTAACLQAIRRHTHDCEIVLVDNGSTPPLEKPYTGFVPLQILRNDENRGFPVAINQGVAAASGETICLLNNDVIVTPGWADRLCAVLDDPEQQFSVVGPVTNYAMGAQRVTVAHYAHAEELDTVASDWAEAEAGHVQPVRWIVGFCMVFPRTVWSAVGPFDESLWPCSGEEIDWCLRAGMAGHRIGVVHAVYVHHEGSQTFKAIDVDYQHIVDRNNAHLESRWGEAWSRQVETVSDDADAIRLNLGCGRFPLRGFVNIDADVTVTPDLVCDAMALPYFRESVDEIYAGHLLEHFAWRDGACALAYWFSLLKPGGRLTVTVPDFDVVAARYLENPTPERLRDFNDTYIYSYNQKSPHRYAYSAALLEFAMRDAGFVGLQRLPVDHPYFPSAVDWQVGYQGTKP